MQTKRETELDILRLLAILAVIMMHAGGNAYLSPNFNANRHSMFVAAIVWCVPAFFMISGRFFLDPQRDVTVQKIWGRYLLRIVIAFVVWSTVYTAFYVLSGAYDALNFWGILTQWIEGPYHFWYLYALMGLYILTPFFRKITEDHRLMIYFVVLFFVINVMSEYFVYFPKTGETIRTALNKFGFGMLMGYCGYYVLGYFIFKNKNKISPKLECIIYAVGIASFAATIVLEGRITPELQAADFVKQYLKPNVILFSAAIYTFFVVRVSRFRFSDRTIRLFGRLTELGFGVYILHAIVNEFASFVPLPQPISHPYLVLVVLTVIIYAVSLALTWLIRKIPYVGKKIT